MTALINELAAQPGEDELLLVLGDYHLVDAAPVGSGTGNLAVGRSDIDSQPPGHSLDPIEITWTEKRLADDPLDDLFRVWFGAYGTSAQSAAHRATVRRRPEPLSVNPSH